MKLYADEGDHGAVRALDVIVVSCLARVEVPAAIWRKQRGQEIAAADAGLLIAQFEADYFGADAEPPRFIVIDIVASLLDRAARLVAARALRAYDALQLASACAVRAVDPDCDAFACADRELRTAAAAEGFTLVP